jgi:hypothetical protein
MERGPAPKGLQNSAQGFNPGNPPNKRFALKGREMGYHKARTSCRAKTRVRNWEVRQLTIEPRFRPVRTFDLATLRGTSLLG